MTSDVCSCIMYRRVYAIALAQAYEIKMSEPSSKADKKESFMIHSHLMKMMGP